MTVYDNNNRGVLFNNADKKRNENDPSYSGSINANGVDYWLSGWIKESKDGKKFFSLSVKPKQPAPRQSSEPTRKPMRNVVDVLDDGEPLPF